MKGGDRDLKMESADDRDLKRPPWEVEGEILRLTSRPKSLPPKRKATTPEAPGAGKKKMKVVKRKLPKELVEYMAECPFRLTERSDEELAQRDPEYSKILVTAKHLEDKTREYWDVLIAQQKLFGYAEDEKEVTDDEAEEVKN